MIIKARYVAPVDRPIIEDGAVVIEHGIIVWVGPAQDADAGRLVRDRGHDRGPFPDGRRTDSDSLTDNDGRVIDYGDAIICPGFVNAHTHLELSHFANRVLPSSDFTDWLGRLMAEAVARPPDGERVALAVRDGIDQSLRAGVTTVGDITRFPRWTRAVLAESPMRGVSFGEVVAVGSRRGLLHERLEAACDGAYAGSLADTPAESRRHKGGSPRHTLCSRLVIGLSPHAPYTVEPEAMRACADRAARIDAPLCIHLAETADEEAFTRSRAGGFVDYLKSIGVWDEEIPASGCGPVELVDRCGLLTPRTIAAHANYVSDADIPRLASHGVSVAYCPRTHHAFEHSGHRFRDMLAAGVNVCIATDSLASNPSLSVLDELRFVHRMHGDVSVETLFAMGTLYGAKALGMDDQIGSIGVGKRADLAVVALPADVQSPMAVLLSEASSHVATFIDGEQVWNRDQHAE